jgi:uncharacterized protein (TIGR02231 family)
MRRIPIALLITACAIATVPARAAELETRSAIDSVIVYPDGAAVTRVIRADLPGGDSVLLARDFPPGLDPASLRVEGQGGAKITIGAIDARPPRAERPPLSPDLENRIEALKDERGVLDDKIAAATARKRFAQRFADNAPTGLGEKGEARPLAEWRAAFQAIADEVATADADIRGARLRQREIDRELARLDADRTANPPRKMEVRIDLAADAATSASFRVTYTVRGARWAPLYDARLDTGSRDRKPALELTRRAEIVQQSGEDWSDVALAVSTVRTAKGGNAPELASLLVRYAEPPRPLASPAQPAPSAQFRVRSSGVMAERDVLSESAVAGHLKADESEAVADTGGFQAVFRIPGRVSVATNEGAKSFRISTAAIAPDLLVRSAPALDAAAYLEASFKQADEAPLLPGRIALYRDGIFVGRGQMALTPKDETLRLGFGVDDKIKVVRTMLRKNESSSGLITTTKTDEREFKITVRNGHDAPIRITVEDQLPVSEIDDVKVETLPSTTQPTERDTRNRRGVLAWSFTAAAAELHEIAFGWRVRWPAGKPIEFAPGT